MNTHLKKAIILLSLFILSPAVFAGSGVCEVEEVSINYDYEPSHNFAVLCSWVTGGTNQRDWVAVREADMGTGVDRLYKMMLKANRRSSSYFSAKYGVRVTVNYSVWISYWENNGSLVLGAAYLRTKEKLGVF